MDKKEFELDAMFSMYNNLHKINYEFKFICVSVVASSGEPEVPLIALLYEAVSQCTMLSDYLI